MSEQNEAQVSLERPDSCEISVNAKGEVSYKVKVYAEHGLEATARAQALKATMDEWVAKQRPKT